MAATIKTEIRAATMPCPAHPCKTCLFGGTNPVSLTPKSHADVLQDILCESRTLTCHSTDNKVVCRGARNLQVSVFHAIGILPEATNEAFERELNAADKRQFPSEA